MTPQVLGALVRRYGNFDTAEDAVQEALLAAASQWPTEGTPENPRAWLITVASRRMTDLLRANQARQRREDTVHSWVLPGDFVAPSADEPQGGDVDDTLILLFMCCHPELPPAGQMALTLRAVGGLTTAEIAKAFFVPESTMAQRISRAKQKIKSSNVPFRLPPPSGLAERVATVAHIVYLIFNEGYSASFGDRLARAELCDEAIRLARIAHRMLPEEGELTGLLALILLTDARRPARIGPGGELVPLEAQDRTRWNAELIAEGVALITAALSRPPAGPYQIQAAIAAVHDEAPDAAQTDWPQIKALYEVLLGMADNPMVRLNYAVAVAMADGALAGLKLLESVAADARLADHHRVQAVRGYLLAEVGDTAGACQAYQAAASAATSLPERRYLQARATELATQ